MRRGPVVALLALVVILALGAPQPRPQAALFPPGTSVLIQPLARLESHTPSPTAIWVADTPSAPILSSLSTPTPDVHHALTAQKCMIWVAAVWFVSQEYSTIDPALTLAVAAKESNCDPGGMDTFSDSTGLMQVNPHNLGLSKADLLDPTRNIWWGMRILTRTLTDPDHNPAGDVRTALAAYNCGWDSLEAGRCYSFGGYVYADSVLEEWVPPLRAALFDYAAHPPEALGKWKVREDVLAWLADWGYATDIERSLP